ncbi:hypothetical protein [Roseovarius mucosus]|uniref:hypothetical protein n=1 Tax=Roseovarius mucosus TaxID=215743 RepID=UPI0012FAD1A7|nr:hypothetical protein [Roseovarius mucosus]
MKQIHPDILNLDPVDPPAGVEKMPSGEILDLEEITKAAGMKWIITGTFGVTYLIIPGSRDLVERGEGYRIFGISEENLPQDSKGRSREIIRRLAYGFHDYAAREVAARYHRDLKRELDADWTRKPKLNH